MKTGFCNWKKCPKRFADHEKSVQHTAARAALKAISRPSLPSQLSKQADLDAVDHRRALHAMIETAMLLSRQGIAFQGNTPEEGNFMQILKMRSNDIPQLRDWMGRRNNWLSHDIQNELINEIALSVQRRLASDLQSADFFSCIADGTQDISGHEQLTILFRVVLSDFRTQDIFLGYYNIDDSSGKSIASALKDVALRFNIPFEKCRGLGFDGAANMSGAFNGAQAVLKKDFPAAKYQHCANHRLDLCLQELAREERLVREVLELVRQIAFFIRESGKRLQQYKATCEEIAASVEDGSLEFTQLTTLCPTRWVIRVKGISSIIRNYKPLVRLLNQISCDRSYTADARTKASGFLRQLTKFETIVGMHISLSVFEPSEFLATKLQSQENSIGSAHQAIVLLKRHMQKLRSDETFAEIFGKADAFREAHDLSPPKERRTKRLPKWVDDHAENAFQHSSFSDKCRIEYFQLIDRIIQALDNRFDDKFLEACDDVESALIRACSNQFSTVEVKAEHFEGVDGAVFSRELQMLPTLAKQGNIPGSFGEFVCMLRNCHPTCLPFFPEVIKVTKLLLTFPVSVASAERSFSTLRRLKTWLRNTMGQKRLTALAVCNIHKRYVDNLDVNDLCDNFIRMTNERRKVFSEKHL